MSEKSIQEKVFINLDNSIQGMFIIGKNYDNPILLFLHGGPGMPTLFLEEKYPSGLENLFTVCYWEQTGGGISFDPKLSPKEVSVDRIVSDAIAISKYLLKRFNREKIYLMGHSWGSLIGALTAAKAPELYSAYIGVSQITNQNKSEKLAFDFMVDVFAEAGNTMMVAKFSAHNIDNGNEEMIKYFKSPLRDKAMHQLGIGTMHNMKSVIAGVFFLFMASKFYTFLEKINFWRAKFFLINKTKLIEELFSIDVTVNVPNLEIPVYFFSGIHDFTVNYTLAKEYLQSLDAPLKGFYSFNSSAHSPMFEEPARFNYLLKNDVLEAKNALADPL